MRTDHNSEVLWLTDDPGRPTRSRSVRRIWRGKGYRKITAHDHARLLLGWLQKQPFLADHLVPASDLAMLYGSFCRSVNLEDLPWQSVAAQLRRLTGGERHYRRVDGRNVRVYPIPMPRDGARIASD
jgi:hypothetical protein